MRKLLVLVLAAAAAWSGYWYVGSSSVQNGLAAWLEDRHKDGWLVEYDSLSTVGFPNRFDTTIENLHLVDTRNGLSWVAPFFQIFTLSYRPNHIIAAWPPEQTFSTPNQNIAVTSELMKASIVFEPGADLTLERSGFDLGSFALTSDLGWRASVENAKFFTKAVGGKDNTHDLWFEANRIQPAHDFKAAIDPKNLLPLVFQGIKIDSELTYDAPWDRHAIETRRPQLTDMNLRDLHVSWGQLDLRLAGKISIDRAGLVSGALTVKAKNWRDMLALAIANGLIPQELAGPVENALDMLAGLSGDKKTLDTPLTFENGKTKLGPLVLGPAPRIARR